MRKLLLPILIAVAVYLTLTQRQDPASSAAPATPFSVPNTTSEIERAFQQRQSNIQVQASGVVDRILSDDNDGSRHQRFIVRLASGHTVLIAHNIDLAPRVAPLATGDKVEFRGEYEWNEKGGVVHWTHHDPEGRHEGGWVKKGERTLK